MILHVYVFLFIYMNLYKVIVFVQRTYMDTLSRLLMMNMPEGSIDQNCLLDNDW